MKCQHCGNREATYHYKSNVNGTITESHLCSECAAKLGESENVFSQMDKMFDEMMNGFFTRTPSLMSAMTSWRPMSFAMPAMVMPFFQLGTECARAPETQGEKSTEEKSAEVDPELKKRREINMLREQMNKAVSEEDFEKAAQLRDQIKELEK